MGSLLPAPTFAGVGPIALGTAGQVLTMVGGKPAFAAAPGGGSVVAKPADTARANTTVVSDDPDLQFAAQPAGTYSVEWFLAASGPTTTANLKLGLNAGGAVTTAFWSGQPVDSSGNRGGNAAQNGASAASVFMTLTLPTGGGQYIVQQAAALLVMSSPGTISLQWAQGTSNAGAVILKQGSWMRLQKIL
jgi:hypothetical protein